MKKYIQELRLFGLMILLMVIAGSEGYSQGAREVTGTITDESGESLPGVNILVKGTAVGTVSNIDGTFKIAVPSDNDILVFSFIGYNNQEISIGNKSSINITLTSTLSDMEEVVVIGFGEQSRELLTTSVSKMDERVLDNVPYSNAASAMQGTLAGVRVQTTSGQPGAAPQVIVRGGTSINNPNGAAPLYVVDGVIRPDINNIAPGDIESFQVLKDAASTSIYGARGSNGVVVITTKSAKSGFVSATYSGSYSLSQPGSLYDLASARDYLTFARRAMIVQDIFPDASFRLTNPVGFGTGNDLTNNTAYTTQYLTSENEYKLNEGWESMPDPLDPSKTLIFQDTDWQDVLFRTAAIQNHHVSVSGGTEKAKVSASLGYLDNEGIAITTGYKRYTMNVNGDFKVSDKFSFYGIVNYANSKDNQVNSITNIFARAITLPPTTKYTFEDGTLAPGQALSEGNPEYVLRNRVAENRVENLTFSVGSRWQITPEFSFDPQLSIYNRTSDSYNFQPAVLNGPTNLVDNRAASATISKWRQTQVDAVFHYSKTFGDAHNVNATAGYAYFGRNTSSLYAAGQGASTDLIPTLNASAEATSVSSSISDQVIHGYFGRVNYDFNYKYLVSVNARYDGASNLGANYQWGFFPGVALGWNMHNETFWETLPQNIFSKLKIRTSYGINGNIGNLGDFAAQGAYGVGYRYGGYAGIQNTIIPNPELKWERSKTLNFGADLTLFDRLGIILDVYRRITDNLITDLALAPSTGFASTLTNLGSLENKGVEIEVNYNILQAASDFQWNLAANLATLQNKILKLPENGVENNRVGGYYVWDASIGDYAWKGGLQEGGQLGEYYSHLELGVYATDQDAESAPSDIYKRYPDISFGGDYIWDDLDDNGVIDEKDMAYVGTEFPTLTGGFTNTFSYKNLMLSLRMDYTMGHTIFNYARAFMEGQWKLNMNMTQNLIDNGWQEQGDIASLPRYDWESTRAQYNVFPTRTGQGYYESGDYLAIRELSISYNLPQSLLTPVHLQNVRLSVTGNNLYYFTKYQGLNPEFGGRDYGRYPIPRNFIFGLNITF
ncbi:SusC/RagA family TonB-linked outer membrane protein [Cyclobacterium marinum]|uniref:SusC/RagA family TonB-linked outer membrane protein n=1 Tax=Cyclobacterium marinum TaxID=104 RepID=UPI0011EF2C0A|nr:TonB-dependent receptor [Cyclobacterium marinum]MBI0398743.1 TonB-dependent receptor [Cyclobacterium marinum]